jgi:sugar/nucleoside kinase (ribokinase family)
VSFGYDYLAVGHVTRDVVEDAPGEPRVQPGGSAFYAALQAARLGLRALIVTRGAPAEIEQLLEPYRGELEVSVEASAQTTTLATRGSGAQRVQRVLAWAGPIEAPGGVSAQIVHLAPVAQETTRSWEWESAFVGITPQGLAREWGADGRISPARLDLRSLPDRFDAAVINERELASCEPLFEAALQIASKPPIAVTAGSGSICVHMPDGTVEAIDPVVAPAVRDDLGAGDVFAATFFVALCDGKPATEAARMGSSSAALRLAGTGPGAVADASAIAELLRP